MAEKSSSTATDKKKKKIWVSILAPKEFKFTEIGETFVEEPSSCIGRFIEQNLMVLSNDPKKQSFNVSFRVNEYKDNALHTEFVGYALQVAQMKRLTRKQKNKIDDSFVCVTKDNIHVRLKPVLVTKAKVTNSKLTLVRHACREFVTGVSKNLTYDQLMSDVVNNDLQRNIKLAVKKVMPLANCIIRAAVKA